jgi:hypothetical protein
MHSIALSASLERFITSLEEENWGEMVEDKGGGGRVETKVVRRSRSRHGGGIGTSGAGLSLVTF